MFVSTIRQRFRQTDGRTDRLTRYERTRFASRGETESE